MAFPEQISQSTAFIMSYKLTGHELTRRGAELWKNHRSSHQLGDVGQFMSLSFMVLVSITLNIRPWLTLTVFRIIKNM